MLRNRPPGNGSAAGNPVAVPKWPSFRWWFPRRGVSYYPTLKRYQYYRGFSAAFAVILVLAGVGSITPGIVDRLRCGQYSVTSGVWYSGGQCVGVSPGSYSFGAGLVMGKIEALNQGAPCQTTGGSVTPVTVGAMVTLGSLNAGARAVHELEGIAAAAYRAGLPYGNLSSGCTHPIRLLVAQMGSNEQAAENDAQMLAADGAVAVVGMGLSSQQSADAAAILTNDQIPMVADVITAEGFDQDGSSGDHPVYTDCSEPGSATTIPGSSYEAGFGKYFFRVSYRAKVQVDDLLGYLARAARQAHYFVVEPTETTDPYTCTVLPLVTDGLAQQGVTTGARSLDFDLSQPEPTQDNAASAICSTNGPAAVFYTARAVYLGNFIDDIIDERRNGDCSPSEITIFSQSDAAQLRVQAPDSGLEAIRQAVLDSAALKDGWLRIYYTPLADPDLLRNDQPSGYTDLIAAFKHLGFPFQDLDDGWAIMGYDAMATVAVALQHIPSTVTGPEIQSEIEDAPGAVPGADGPVTFDNSGNRVGSGPGVVRLCPEGGPPGDPVTTVPVTNGSPGSCRI
jgi:ABC-type branched-subunit amino acid transport system substrate-binding protein